MKKFKPGSEYESDTKLDPYENRKKFSVRDIDDLMGEDEDEPENT